MDDRLTAEQHYAEGMRELRYQRETSTLEASMACAALATAHFAAATAVQAMAPAEPERCVAHGRPACQNCHLTKPDGLDDDGNCSGCARYADTGMHWDTCPNRAYVVLWATDNAEIEAVHAVARERGQ